MPTFSRISRFFSKRWQARRGTPRANAGFTLIELLVVSAIIAIITGVVLFRQKGFNSATLLRSLAYSVALTMRQAQVYGNSVRESAAGSGVFASGYGVYFGNTGLVDNSHYLMFSDANGDGQYAAGEELPRFTMGNGRGTDYLIKNYCAHTSSGDQCGIGTGTTITSLTVYFRRPNPDACFATSQYPAACAADGVPAYDYAYVQVQSAASGDYRTIKISSTGQIAVCKPNLDAAGIAAC
jgi:prepilin-type N-terminal cleavage/methylation domain-containing protein